MKFEPIIGTDLSGHIGGVVASHNTYGPYFRKRVRPVNRRTEGQLAQRLALQIVSQAWRALDPGVQATWKATEVTKTSKSGRVVKLTGQAAWMFVNLMRWRIGLSMIATPPTSPVPTTLTLPVAIFTPPDQLSLEFDPNDEWNDTDGGIIISGSAPLGPGVTFCQSFSAVGVSIFPYDVPIIFNYPNTCSGGEWIKLRLHASSPSGRQSVVTDMNVTVLPALASVTGVFDMSSTEALWAFSENVTADGTNDIVFEIAETSPQTVKQAGPNSIIATYPDPIVAPAEDWALTGTPAHVTAAVPIKQPDSGKVT